MKRRTQAKIKKRILQIPKIKILRIQARQPIKKDSTKSDDKNTPPKDKTDPSASTVTVIPDPLNDKDKFATLVDGEVDLAKQALIIKQQELMAI